MALSFAALCAFTACVEEYDDAQVDNATRITLSPEPEQFEATGKTASGADSYIAAVVLNEGPKVSGMDWKAEITGSPAWVKAVKTDLTEEFKEIYSGDKYSTALSGIKVTVEPNTEYKRTFVLNIVAADGTVEPYEFVQVGEKADAAVTTEVKNIEFMAQEPQPYEIAYTTNMGDVYSVSVVYEGTETDWLSYETPAAGTVILTATEWENTTDGRSATVTITVGTEDTSIASVSIPVYQLPKDNYYFMYGASARKLTIENSFQMTKVTSDVYTAEAFFLNSADGSNNVLFNKNSRSLTYPYYALAADGTVAVINSASDALPQGPAIDVDGLRSLTVDFTSLTWSWERAGVTPNCCPDEEVANYPTKDYVAQDGTVKTWMTVGLHWNGGASMGTYKLGSGLVGLHQSGGYGGADQTVRVPEYDTQENGGTIAEVLDANGNPLAESKGRLYSTYEALTGEPAGALSPTFYAHMPFGIPGDTFTDALGDEYVVEAVTTAILKGYEQSAAGDLKAEEEHPTIKSQIQGICPYGWHIANLQDWKDLAYAAAVASASSDYPMNIEEATYFYFGNKGMITNFAAHLFDPDWAQYKSEKDLPLSNINSDFGFNMFCQGWRLHKTGYDYGPGDSDPRFYAMIPLLGTYTENNSKAWRMWNQSQESRMRTNGGFDAGNGSGAAVRCVKNYVK